MILGTLGHLVWYRCDDCGMDYNVPADANEHDPCCPMCGACSDDDSDDD
jgi:hypothetical protein